MAILVYTSMAPRCECPRSWYTPLNRTLVLASLNSSIDLINPSALTSYTQCASEPLRAPLWLSVLPRTRSLLASLKELWAPPATAEAHHGPLLHLTLPPLLCCSACHDAHASFSPSSQSVGEPCPGLEVTTQYSSMVSSPRKTFMTSSPFAPCPVLAPLWMRGPDPPQFPCILFK